MEKFNFSIALAHLKNGRKVARDGGAALNALRGQMKETQAELAKQSAASFKALAAALGEGIAAVAAAGEYIVANYGKDPRTVAVGAVPFLRLLGIVSGGWMMARAALAAQAKN
ncbi:MAG TPA: acyl-CoA dehydrogenase C-terminal domain-containing protein, partial [Kofleriaceae bacterium]|nr:acyl-CoA dehydrogenase C-terminal domain-containing protein [Kofleriaceae bacterium]